MTKKEIHYKYFFKLLEENNKNRVWSLQEITDRINKLLPTNLEVTRINVAKIIRYQTRYMVFKTIVEDKRTQERYYIFRKRLNGVYHET